MMNNNLVVCNCANCEQCNSDDFEFYCNAINQKRRRIARGCDLFKCRFETCVSTSVTTENIDLGRVTTSIEVGNERVY